MPTYLTKSGIAKLEKELTELTKQKRELSAEVEKARAHGDLRENAEYQYGKEKLAQVVGKMGQIQAKLADVKLVDPKKSGANNTATIGARIKVKDLTTQDEDTYVLVGPDESDPAAGKISIESPMGRAFLGKKVKEKVSAALPAGPRPFQILSVQPDE
jgi:transcription elongation factor GreA